MDQARYDAARSPDGPLFVGSPAEIVEKLLYQHELFGNDRFLGQISLGALPHGDALQAIELLGSEVGDGLRAALGRAGQLPVGGGPE